MSSILVIGFKWKFFTNSATTVTISFLAKFCPIQLRELPLNGIYANGCWTFRSKNRSGSNFSGSSKYFGSRCRAYIRIWITVFAGSNTLSARVNRSLFISSVELNIYLIKIPISVGSPKIRPMIGTGGYNRSVSLINAFKYLKSASLSLDMISS